MHIIDKEKEGGVIDRKEEGGEKGSDRSREGGTFLPVFTGISQGVGCKLGTEERL